MQQKFISKSLTFPEHALGILQRILNIGIHTVSLIDLVGGGGDIEQSKDN